MRGKITDLTRARAELGKGARATAGDRVQVWAIMRRSLRSLAPGDYDLRRGPILSSLVQLALPSAPQSLGKPGTAVASGGGLTRRGLESGVKSMLP